MHKIQRRNISICFHFVENFIIRTDVKSKVRFLKREQKKLYIRFLVEKISWISKIGTNYSLNKHRFDKIIILNAFCRWNYFAMANIKFVRKKIQFGLMLSTFRPDSNLFVLCIWIFCENKYAESSHSMFEKQGKVLGKTRHTVHTNKNTTTTFDEAIFHAWTYKPQGKEPI